MSKSTDINTLILDVVQGLLKVVRNTKRPTAVIIALDAAMEEIEMAVDLIESNWVSRKDRKARLIKKRNELNTRIKFLDDLK